MGQLTCFSWDAPGRGSAYLFGDNEILGNAFVFLFAGHETIAGNLHFALILLAMNPSVQRQLQNAIQEVLGERPVEQWSFATDLPRLQNNMVGAVLNETLRIVAPVQNIMKSTREGELQEVTLSNGQRATLPPRAWIGISIAALHRNPAHWPRVDSNDPDDLQRFRPQRWLNKTESGEPTLFAPHKGAFIPFSEGARPCLGKRFAQVESVAALAMLFKDWSLELDLTVIDKSLASDPTGYEAGLKGMASEERSR